MPTAQFSLSLSRLRSPSWRGSQRLRAVGLAALALAGWSSAVSRAAGADAAVCDVRSGPKTTALIELYTSEGCSSCPPADRQLSRLRQTLAPAADVVPLALHVGYWDSLGWKDAFAQPAFAERQSWLVHLNAHRTVYTPHFFVSGTELRGWQDGLRDEVRRLNDRPAAADLHLRTRLTPGGALSVAAEAAGHAPEGAAGATAPDGGDLALYVAVTEDGLQSVVSRGENGGATLAHDHVVRQWAGPLAFAAGRVQSRTEIALPPSWNRAHLTAVAFVQNQRTGQVVQALSTASCPAL